MRLSGRGRSDDAWRDADNGNWRINRHERKSNKAGMRDASSTTLPRPSDPRHLHVLQVPHDQHDGVHGRPARHEDDCEDRVWSVRFKRACIGSTYRTACLCGSFL